MAVKEFKTVKPVCNIGVLGPNGHRHTLSRVLAHAVRLPVKPIELSTPPFTFRDAEGAEIWHMQAATMEPAILSRMTFAANFAGIVEIASKQNADVEPYIEAGISQFCLYNADGDTFHCDALRLLTLCWRYGHVLKGQIEAKWELDNALDKMRTSPNSERPPGIST